LAEEVSESVHPKWSGHFRMTAENSENIGRVRRSRRGYRQWTTAQKRQIVAETLDAGASVSVVARRHDVNANQLFLWRRQYQRGEMGNRAALVPVGVIGAGGIVSALSDLTKQKSDLPPVPHQRLCSAVPQAKQPKMIEVELRSGTRIRIDGDVKGSALQQVLKLIRSLA
jgi:transposase